MVVLQEIFGVDKAMRDIADDLASNDYFSSVPDLLRRQEPGIRLSSGMVAPIGAMTLGHKGAFYPTRPTRAHHTATRDALVETASDLFAVVGSGAVKIEARQTYALTDAKDAHRDLEARKTTGSKVMLP